MDRGAGRREMIAADSADRAHASAKSISPALWLPTYHPSLGRAGLDRLARNSVSERCALAHRAVELAGGCSNIGYIHAAADLLQATVTSVAVRFGWAPMARVRRRGAKVEIVGASANWLHMPSHASLGFGDPDDREFVASLYLYLTKTNAVLKGRLSVQGDVV